MSTRKSSKSYTVKNFKNLDLRRLDIDLDNILNSQNPVYFLMLQAGLNLSNAQAIHKTMVEQTDNLPRQSFIDTLDFSNKNLNKANLSDLQLKSTNHFKGANFKDANLKRTNFCYANFSNLSQKQVIQLIKRQQSFYFKIKNAPFNQWRQLTSQIEHTLLKKTQKKGGAFKLNPGYTNQTQLTLRNNCANFSGANLFLTDFTGAYLYGADLQSAKIFQTNFAQAHLLWANLRQHNLEHINFRGADLRWSCLAQTNLSHADLRDADLRYANFTGSKIKHALINRETKINRSQRHYFDNNLIIQ